jgi:cardiolipin synthase
VEDLSNRAYFPAILKEIQTAQKSIYACLYYISYNQREESPTKQLLQALIKAKKKGVTVEVLLDQSFESFDMRKKNIRAYSYLHHSGVPVFYDDMKTLTHAKYLIFDEKTLILGSTNWSDAALNLNRECATLIRSTELAIQYLQHFQAIPKTSPEPIKEAIPIPREFMRNKSQASRILSNRSKRLLDFYLWLLEQSYHQKSATVVLSEQQIFEHCYQGIRDNFNRKSVLSYFMDSFAKPNKKKFPFMKCDYDSQKRTVTFHIEKRNTDKPESLYLSKLYWNDGWFKRLSEKAIFSLLYVLDKTDSGRAGRYFEQERDQAAKEYKVNHTIFAYGLIELQRWNLIEKDINWKHGGHESNGYILNDFYCLKDFENTLKKIENKTTPEIFTLSLKIADLVNEPYAPEAIKKIIELGEKYGAPLLKKAIEIIQPKGGLSPYRQYAYVVAMIRNIGEGKDGRPVEL